MYYFIDIVSIVYFVICNLITNIRKLNSIYRAVARTLDVWFHVIPNKSRTLTREYFDHINLFTPTSHKIY